MFKHRYPSLLVSRSRILCRAMHRNTSELIRHLKGEARRLTTIIFTIFFATRRTGIAPSALFLSPDTAHFNAQHPPIHIKWSAEMAQEKYTYRC